MYYCAVDRLRVGEAPTEYSVRPRRLSDIAQCIRVLRQVHETDRYPLHWPQRPREFVASSKELGAWVALSPDGSVCGHVALHRADGHDLERTWVTATGRPSSRLGVVARMFTSPEVRRRGVGAMLLDVATQRARDLGLQPVLDVGQYNAEAAKLYEREGWLRVGRFDDREIPIFAYVRGAEASSCDDLAVAAAIG